jgi:REP element-mobilizing transposase RayT
MARPLRIEKPGGWYHVSARGNERKAIFRDDRDRRHFLEVLAEMVARFRVRLHGYVLMDNHYHLLLELIEPNLSRAVQWLNVSYSIWFNHRHGRSGHLFQGRFKSVVVSPEEWALSLSRYVHLNPVRIQTLGLSKTDRQVQRVGLSPTPNAAQVRERITLLRRYRWSSYRAYIGLERAPEWLECQTVLGLGGQSWSEAASAVSDLRGNGGAGGVGEKPVGIGAGAGGAGRRRVSGGIEEVS